MKKIKFIIISFIDFIRYLINSLYYNLLKNKVEDVWLISERGIEARDNGYYFYKYLKVNHPELNVKFVIDKKSVDCNKLDSKDIVYYRTKEHYYYLFCAKYLLSSHIMGVTPNDRLYFRLKKYGILKLKGKNIFLQHGVTQNYMDYLKCKNTGIDFLICTSKKEYEYFIDAYGYKSSQLILSGFPRFDDFGKNVKMKKQIFIMPTYRKWLKFNSKISDTDFYKNYYNLLTNKELISLFKEKGYNVVFYLHPLFQQFSDEFKSNDDNIIIATSDKYDIHELLKESELLITDYSSVAFDFAYMGKNVFYYQFDLNKFRTGQYEEGYFSYEDDGFGPVCYSFDDIKKNLVEYLNSPEVIKNKYNGRYIDFFMPKFEGNICEKIYEGIIKK